MDIVALVILAVILIVVAKGVRVVPQQNAWVVARLGKFHAVLGPGLNLVIPFIDAVAYKHSLKEIPLDVPTQVCTTRHNPQLAVDGILYFQVTDAKMASYGSSNYIDAISQLAQTTLRSMIGRMEMDRTFEERDDINRGVVLALNEASTNWGVKVLRYEIKDIAAPTAEAIARAARAVELPGGMQAVNLKVAEKYVEAFAGIAKAGNTLIVPSNMADISSMIAGARTVVSWQG